MTLRALALAMLLAPLALATPDGSAPCLVAPFDPARVEVVGAPRESLAVDFSLASPFEGRLWAYAGVRVLDAAPAAERRADRAMLWLRVEDASGATVAEHVIDDARPLLAATTPLGRSPAPHDALLGCGAMDLFRDVALPAGRYRAELVGGSESGGNLLLSLPAGAVVERVRAGPTITLSESAMTCDAIAHAGTTAGNADALVGCHLRARVAGEARWIFGSTIQRDATHRVDWIDPTGAVVPVEGYPARGRGGAGAWTLIVPVYAPNVGTGEGFHGVLADLQG